MNNMKEETKTPVTTEPSPSELSESLPPEQKGSSASAPENSPQEHTKTPDEAGKEGPADVKEEPPKEARRSSFAMFENLLFRLSIKEKMLFARHMEMMTRSGLQVLDALVILRKQTKSSAFIRVLDSLIADVKNGHYLSVAMERYKRLFGDFVINLIRVGETSGTLSENFKYLAVELEKKSELQKKVLGAMIYPIVILIATFGITGIMVFLIFPRILPVLKSLNVELPLATRVFIAISEFLTSNIVWVLLGLFVLVIGWLLLLRIRPVRYAWHRTLLRIPFIGPLVTDVNIITIARTMDLLLRGGVLIVEALEISGRSLNNLVYQKQIEEIKQSVQRGEPMSKLMIERPALFPATFSEMAHVGETTGKLDETLEFLAEFYESELDSSTKTLSNVLEPLLLLAMGLVVSFVAISIITPIYKISQSLGR